ncbi:MAG TPA: hypothetical protein VF021_00165 [Longimicrobiales bacterium]
MLQKLLLTMLLAAGACSSTTDNGNSSLSVKGTWSYSGMQTAPAVSIAGVISIDQQTGSSFSGSAQLRETDAQGTIRDVVGQVNGRVIAADAVDFDIFIQATTRRHVARVAADSMGGTWAVTGTTTTGSFTARRLP